MNQLRTLCISFTILILVAPQTATSTLARSLKTNEIKQLQKNIMRNPKNMRSRLFLADHYYKEKQWAKVIKTLSPVVENATDEALYKLAVSYFTLKSFRASETIVNTLLSRPKNSAKYHLLAADIYAGIIAQMNQSEASVEWTEKLFTSLKVAQKRHPSNRAVYDKWLNYLEKFIPPFASEALRVMEDMRDNNVPLVASDYSRLCRYNHLANFSKAAQEACEKAILEDPKNPANHIYLGETHLQNGQRDKGKRMLASVGEKFANSEEALWATANSHYESKNTAAAYTYFSKAVKHPRAKPRDFLGLAKSAFDLKKYDVALKAFVQHCQQTKILNHEFRRASGLLKTKPRWQYQFRQKMMDCNSNNSK